MRRVLKYISLTLVLFVVSSCVYSHVSTMNDTAPYQMIEVEPGRFLHTRCAGPADRPFVLYDAGAFGIYADGWWIQHELQTDARICVYDRAGMGWSDPVPTGQTPSALWHVEDMRRLATAIGASQPYYLIGHSMAGIRLHTYANTYPDELAGLIFIDAARPQNFDFDNLPRWVQLMRPLSSLGTFAARIGLTRAFATFSSDPLSLPPQAARDKRRSQSIASHMKATRAELLAFADSKDHYAATNAEHLPVSVFAASASGGNNRITAKNAELNSGFGRLNTLPEESHVSLLAQPTARLIADDLRAMIAHVEQSPE